MLNKLLFTALVSSFLLYSVFAQNPKVIPQPPSNTVKEWTRNTLYWHPLELFQSYLRLAYETEIGTSGNSLLIGGGAILQKNGIFNQNASTIGFSSELHYRVSLLTDPEKGYRLFYAPFARFLYLEERSTVYSYSYTPTYQQQLIQQPLSIINSYMGGLTIGVKARMLKVFYFCTYTGFAAKYSVNRGFPSNSSGSILSWGYTGIVPVLNIQFGVKL